MASSNWEGYRRPPSWSDVGFGLCVVALAGIMAWQVTEIPPSFITRIGPAVFPWVATAIVGVLGAILVVQGLLGGWPHDEELGHLDFAGGVWMIVGLVLNVVVIDRLGFVVASTVMFVFVARAFGSRQPLRDLLIGAAVAIVAYVGFDRTLGYRIGTGIVDLWLNAGIDAAVAAIRQLFTAR